MPQKIRKYSNETAQPDDAFGAFQSSDLNMLLLEGNFPELLPQIAHGLRITDQAESTPTTSPNVFWNPKSNQVEMREIERTRTYRINVKFEIDIPPYTSSRIFELALAGVRKDVIDYLPGSDYNQRSAEIYSPETGLKEPIASDERHMGGTDPSSARRGYTTGAQTGTIKKILGVELRDVNDLGANPIYAVAWLNPDYNGGRLESPPDVIVGGAQLGDAADKILAVMSSGDGRFDTQSDIATGLAAGSIITGVLQIGEKTVVTYTDNIDPTTATTGGIAVYSNGVVTEALLSDAPTAEPMYALAYDKATDRYIAVGKGGKVYAAKKTSLTTLSELSNASVTSNMLDIAVYNGVAYIACEDGNAYTLSGLNFTDITDDVTGALTPASLNSVAYLGHQHLMFGGPLGFISETLDGGDNWFEDTINAGAGTVGKIVGETWRTIVAVDGIVIERSVVTPELIDGVPQSLDWRTLELVGGASLSGSITDMAMLTWMDGPNVLVVVTDAAEIAYAKPTVMQY